MATAHGTDLRSGKWKLICIEAMLGQTKYDYIQNHCFLASSVYDAGIQLKHLMVRFRINVP